MKAGSVFIANVENRCGLKRIVRATNAVHAIGQIQGAND